jgi:hypothetical protein
MIKTLMKITILRSLDGKMPGVNIILQRSCFQIRMGLFEHVPYLLIDSSLTYAAFHFEQSDCEAKIIIISWQ